MLGIASSTALATGAILTGIAAIVTAYAALVKARGEAHGAAAREHDAALHAARQDAAECWEQLRAERHAHLHDDTGPLEHPGDGT